MKRIFYPFSFLLFYLFISCTQDAYEKGEGEYSLMRGDFAEAYVNASKEMEAITTDDGERLSLKEKKTAKWVNTADTTYRCMLYYNKVQDQSGQFQADVISIGQVPCPRIVPFPKFESIWLSRTGKYLTMSLQVMSGHTDDTTAVHQLSFVSDTLMTHADHSRTLHVRLHHDQHQVPEYYSVQAYVSLLVDSILADSIHFTVNTYNGTVVKTLSLRK